MKKKKRRLRKCIYDLIINVCLFGAIICLIIGTNAYMKNFENQTIIDVVKQVLLQPPSEEEPVVPYIQEQEPPKLFVIDKSIIIINYLDKIKDNIIVDSLITYESISTWSTFEIYDVIYTKQITNNYYLYNVLIKLPKDAISPVPINDKLSTEEYNIISLNIYIYGENDDYTVKKIDPN